MISVVHCGRNKYHIQCIVVRYQYCGSDLTFNCRVYDGLDDMPYADLDPLDSS